jgi:hypothetical protein
MPKFDTIRKSCIENVEHGMKICPGSMVREYDDRLSCGIVISCESSGSDPLCNILWSTEPHRVSRASSIVPDFIKIKSSKHDEQCIIGTDIAPTCFKARETTLTIEETYVEPSRGFVHELQRAVSHCTNGIVELTIEHSSTGLERVIVERRVSQLPWYYDQVPHR